MSDGSLQLRRAIGWLGGGVFASALLQYLLFFVAARYLGVADYGAFSLALTIALLAAPFCDLGTSVALVCTGSRRPEELLQQFGASLLLRAFTFVPVALLAIGGGLVVGYGTDFVALFVPLFVAAVADGIGNLCSAACQSQERMATSAVIQVSRNLLRGAALFGTLAVGGGPLVLSVSFAIASVLGLWPALRQVAQGRSIPCRRADLGPALRAAAPFGLAILATILHSQIGVALLGIYATDDEVGRYHASARFVLLLQMLPQVVAMASAPLAFRTGALGVEPSARLYRVKITALAMLGLLAALVLSSQGDWLVATCLGDKFRGSEVLLIALAPIVFVKFVSSSLGDTLSAISRQDRLSLGCWLALFVNVAVSLLLMPTIGAMGAVVATLASESFLLLFLAVNLLLAGLDLAWRHVLGHPLVIAVAAGVTAALATPRLAAPVAFAVAVLLLWLRPTQEERLLLRRDRGGTA